MNFFNGNDEEDPLGNLLAMGGAPASDPTSAMPQAPPMQQAPPMAPGPDLDQEFANLPGHDYVAKKYGLGKYSPENREKAGADTNPVLNGLSAALAGVSAGFQGRDSIGAVNSTIAQQAREKDARLSEFDKSRDNALKYEAEDPDSDSSKRFRATLKANFPEIASKYGGAFDNLTAADQKSVFQVAETKAKLEGAQAQREAVNNMKKTSNQARQDALDERRKMALSAQDDKDAKALEKHLGAGWLARGGQAGLVQGKINAAERAQALLDQAKSQPGGLDSRQIEELAQSTSNLLGSGTQASARVEGLIPHTLFGRTQSLKEYLTNNPTGQGMQAFTDRLAETIGREKKLADTQKKQFQIEGLGAHSRLKKSNPELYNQMLQEKGIDPSMIDEKGRYKVPDETKVIGDKTYKKVPGGWQLVPELSSVGRNDG